MKTLAMKTLAMIRNPRQLLPRSGFWKRLQCNRLKLSQCNLKIKINNKDHRLKKYLCLSRWFLPSNYLSIVSYPI